MYKGNNSTPYRNVLQRQFNARAHVQLYENALQ